MAEFKQELDDKLAEMKELVDDTVLGNAQSYFDRLSDLKVTPPRQCLATSSAVWKSISVSAAPDNSSLSHFSATTLPCWLNRA